MNNLSGAKIVNEAKMCVEKVCLEDINLDYRNFKFDDII